MVKFYYSLLGWRFGLFGGLLLQDRLLTLVLLLFLLLVFLFLLGHCVRVCGRGLTAEDLSEARGFVTPRGRVSSFLLLYYTIFVWIVLFANLLLGLGPLLSTELHHSLHIVIRLLFLFFFLVSGFVVWRELHWFLVLQKWLLTFHINILTIFYRSLTGHRHGFFRTRGLSFHLLLRKICNIVFVN